LGETLGYIPQIQLDTTALLLDTMEWSKISGVYTAVGNERFLTIGNFYADSQTDTLSHLGTWILGYYYIDDVSVYEISNRIAGNNSSICYRDSIQLGVPEQHNTVY